MRILKGIVVLCFVVIIALIFLTYIQLPAVGEYQLEITEISPYHIGWTAVDTITASFHYLLISPTITSGLLIFMYFVGVAAASYTGFILGIIVAVAERRKKTDFLFMLSFITCLFFAIFTTAIAVLV